MHAPPPTLTHLHTHMLTTMNMNISTHCTHTHTDTAMVSFTSLVFTYYLSKHTCVCVQYVNIIDHVIMHFVFFPTKSKNCFGNSSWRTFRSRTVFTILSSTVVDYCVNYFGVLLGTVLLSREALS